jgi:hypothetical protein
MVLYWRAAAKPGRWLRFGLGDGVVLGGVGEGDFAAGEVFELADEVVFAAPFVDLGVIVVGAEFPARGALLISPSPA